MDTLAGTKVDPAAGPVMRLPMLVNFGVYGFISRRNILKKSLKEERRAFGQDADKRLQPIENDALSCCH